jgi:hypothetical protein
VEGRKGLEAVRRASLDAWLDDGRRVAVQFLRPHPAVLLDCGGRPCALGPFRPGDIALLPAWLAAGLIRRGFAREFSLSRP